jgi:AcrR family transcriptional regulator
VARPWKATKEAYGLPVVTTILDTTAALVAAHGLRRVTMARIAKECGVGRATVYRYFPDVGTILVTWHERETAGHVERLAELRDRPGGPAERLQAVLDAYAFIRHEHHRTELAALLHGGGHVASAEQQITDMIGALLAETAASGDTRDDIPPAELATFCVHALAAAGTLRSKPAVRRLVIATLAGLRQRCPRP